MAESLDLWGDIGAAFVEAAGPRLALPDWVERKRIVVGGANPGPWSWAHGFLSRDPLAAVSARDVEMVVLLTPAQLMKTEFGINVALHTAENGDDCLLYEPDLPLLESMVADRVRPAMQALGTTTAIGVDERWRKKRDSRVEVRLGGRGTVKGLTPAMKTGDAAYTGRVVILDEVDRMGRADMLIKARARMTTYGADARLVVMSTPTIDEVGRIWRLWSEGSRGEWRARCRHCGEHVSVDWSRVEFDRDAAGWWRPESAALVCEGCGVRWTEPDRLAAVRAGCYVHADPEHPRRTFRVPGPAHLWRSTVALVAEGAAAYRAATEEHSIAQYRAWYNDMAALPWEDQLTGLSATRLSAETFDLGARGERDRGTLDPRALVITVGADVGAHAVYAEWVAWGVDPRTREILSWALQYRVFGGSADDSIEDPDLWADVEAELNGARWRQPLELGRAMGAWRMLIDARYRPEIVRAWCRDQYRRELEGTERRAEPFTARVLPLMSFGARTRTERYPVNLVLGAKKTPRRPISVPCVVWVSSEMVKDMVYEWKLADRRRAGAESAHRWPHDGDARGYDPAYFREFANEVRRTRVSPRGERDVVWEKRSPSVAVEAWDCRVYALAGAFVEAYPRPLDRHLLALHAAREARLRGTVAEVVRLHGRDQDE